MKAPNVNVKTLLAVLTRAMILGMIVFSSITYIPKNNIEMRNRIVISAVVVVLYALVDYFGGFLKKVRAFLCNILCGCNPNTQPSSDDLEDLEDKILADI